MIGYARHAQRSPQMRGGKQSLLNRVWERNRGKSLWIDAMVVGGWSIEGFLPRPLLPFAQHGCPRPKKGKRAKRRVVVRPSSSSPST